MKNIRKIDNAYVLLPAAIIAISTASILIRFAQVSLSSLTIATYRLALASLFLLPFALRRTVKSISILCVKELGLLLVSGVFLAMHFFLWIMSLEYTTIVSSVVLVTTTPIWVAIISPFLTGDKPSGKFWVGLGVAMAGIVIISSGAGQGEHGILSAHNAKQMAGNGFALLGAVCAAFYVIIGRIMRKTVANDVYTFSVYFAGALTLLVAMILSPSESLVVKPGDLKWLVLLAAVPQLIGHSLINRFLGTLPAHQVSLFLLGEPVGSAILAMIFLGEMPVLNEALGGVIILTGIGIAVIANR